MSDVRAPRPRWPVPIGVGLAASALFLVSDNPWIQTGAYLGTYLLGTVLLVRTWWRRRGSSNQRLLGYFAIGVVLYFAGSVGFWVWPLFMERPLPVPSVVDASFFSSYLMFGAFLLQLALRHGGADRRAGLDALIVVLGLVPTGYLALVEPMLRDNSLSSTEAIYAAYPVAVVVLLGFALWVAFVAMQRTMPHLLLAGWIGTELLADVVFARTGVAGTYANGQAWQVLWVISAAFIGALALHPDARVLAEPEAIGASSVRSRLLLMGGALSGPLIALMYADHEHVQGSAVFICAGTTLILIVLTIARLWGLTTDVVEQRRLLAELQRLSEDLKFQALHDPLTGLGNRTMFADRADHALAQRVVAQDRAAAVVLLDLDDFKSINDAAGHHAGDEVLVEVSRRLQRVTRQGETVIRLGGDEFAIIMERAHLSDVLRLTDRVQGELSQPMRVDQQTIIPRASIGIAIALDGQDRHKLLAQADIAMYAAKNRGGLRAAVFDAALHQEVLDRHSLESDLRSAAASGQLQLLYQPLVELATNRMVGVEALVRWQHPTRGIVSPVEFIPLAEATGSILDIGDWVLTEACRQLLAWDYALPDRPLRISVNVSPRQLADPEFVTRAGTILGQAGLDVARVTLEVTEAALGTDTETMIERLSQLKELGACIAIDDFGTGYSSLSHLRRLPVDILKIDRSFVTGIAREPAEWALTTAIVRLAASLGKTTLAEGIETGAQLAHLRSLNVELGQGYLFSQPVPPSVIADLAAAVEGEAFQFD